MFFFHVVHFYALCTYMGFSSRSDIFPTDNGMHDFELMRVQNMLRYKQPQKTLLYY